MALKTLRPLVRTTNTSTTPLPPKVKDAVYSTPEFMAWRILVVKRAGYQCEAVDQRGLRCSKGHPEHRLFADHIRELKDGGSLTDPANGQALCYQHHTTKTIAARMRRHRSS
jgi:hypothetical protein